MKHLALALISVTLLPSTSSQQVPPPLLCSAVQKWQIRLTAMVVEKAPNDAGSHEEWTQNFILFGDGPFAPGFQARTFEINPPDEIPNRHPPFPVPLPSIGTLELDNGRADDHVRFGGKERDTWPNPDDKLPTLDIPITNPCHVSVRGALTVATNLVKNACGEGHGRRACYTVTATPL